MPKPAHLEQTLSRMRADWDQRARRNARYYVNTEREDWTDADFFATGEADVREQILNDMTNICQGKDPKEMRVLEVGCGVGRMTRALASVFGEVHGVDVSAEMVAQGGEKLRDTPNAHLFANNGMDLSVLPCVEYDFAFSMIVFQHIPSRDVIWNYVREVRARLRPGGLFKLQVQGDTSTDTGGAPLDTWHGVGFSDTQAVEMAEACGFEARHRHGAGDQYFWLWFFKR